MWFSFNLTKKFAGNNSQKHHIVETAKGIDKKVDEEVVKTGLHGSYGAGDRICLFKQSVSIATLDKAPYP